MEEFKLFILSGAITLVGILAIIFSPSGLKSKLAFLTVLFTGILTSIPAIHALTGHALDIFINGSSLFGNIPVRLDALSAWFILIINFTCVNGALYGIGYMKAAHPPTPSQREGEESSGKEASASTSLHWSMFVLFQASMIAVCVIQHGLAFLVAWEIMSLSSFLLVIYEYQNQSVLKAGMNYLIQMHLGVLFLTAAFIWIYFSNGSYDFAAIGQFFHTAPQHYNLGLFALFFAGFGIKAGFIPLHSWLPYAHPAAPSHVSGVMSGVIVKMGIYGILRVALMFPHDNAAAQSTLMLIGELILILSVATAIYGILNSAVYRDFKKMLAYCTIENIGIIGTAIGLALMGLAMNNPLLSMIGFTAALLHTLNHSLFKSLLFFSAGGVYHQTHTRDIEKLGGLIHRMPQTAALFLIGALAIGGLPPFNGFVSEFLIYTGLLKGIQTMSVLHSTLLLLTLGGLAFVGGLSLLTFTKNFSTIFLGSPRTEFHEQPVESPLIMRIPQYLIVAVMLSIGVFPVFYFSIAGNAINSLVPMPFFSSVIAGFGTINILAQIGIYSFAFLLLIIGVLILRRLMIRQKALVINKTWGCGYVGAATKMQFTGKSYSKSLGKLLSFIVAEKKKYIELRQEEIFPATRKHSSHYTDFFERNIFDGFINRLIHSLGFFRFVQNGRIQMYVLYGVLFIVVIFLGTLFGML